MVGEEKELGRGWLTPHLLMGLSFPLSLAQWANKIG